MIFLVFDQHTEKRICDLDFDLVENPRLSEDLEGMLTLQFSYPLAGPDAEYIRQGNMILCQDRDGNWLEFEIKKINDRVKARVKVVNVFCESSHYELQDEELITFNFTSHSAQFALSQILAKTRWEPGIVQIGTTRTRSMINTDPLAAVWDVSAIWGGELRFRIILSGTRVIHRYVDLLQRRGSFTGKRFEFGYDLEEVDIITDRTQIKTAMYGWGQGAAIDEGDNTERIDFADAEWVKGEPAELHPGGDMSPAPFDKPLGQTWVGDEVARQKHGRGAERRHIFDEYASQAQSPQALLWETARQLQKVTDPLVNVKSKVAVLERQPGYGHERVRLGDSNYVIVDDIPELEARIIRIDWDLKDESDTKVEQGNFRPASGHNLADLERRQRRIDARSGIYDRAKAFTPGGQLPTSVLDGVIDAARNQLLAGGGTFVANGDGAWTLDTGDPATATGAIRQVAYNGEAALLIGKRATPLDPWEFRVGMTSEGFRLFAEEVVAGRFRADQIFIGPGTDFSSGYNPIEKATPDDVAVAKAAAEAHAEQKAAEAQSAAESFATAEAELKAAQAQADAEATAQGMISTETQARLDQAAANLQESKQYADQAADAAEQAAKSYAELKAQEAEDAAKAVAEAEAELAKLAAQAYADGKVSEEEQARIQQAINNLHEAKAHAELKASEAQSAAEAHAELKAGEAESNAKAHAELKAQEAQDAAEAYALAEAEAKAAAAQAAAELAAEGMVSAETQARLTEAEANLQEAKQYADTQASAAQAAAQNYAELKAGEAQAAAEAVAEAKAELARIEAEAYADGKVSAEEAARIAEAQANLAEAKNHAEQKAQEAEDAAKTYAETKADEAENSAKAFAETKAQEAQDAAEVVAEAKAALAQATAEAYADGIVSAEEQARIQQAIDNLNEAKSHAELKAGEAQAAAQTYAETKANEAQQAAEAVAEAKAALAQAQAEAYADGKVSAEEQARIAEAQANLDAAKAHADAKASEAELAANAYAELKAAEAQAAAETYAIAAAEAAREAAEAEAQALAELEAARAQAALQEIIDQETLARLAQAEQNLTEAREYAEQKAEAARAAAKAAAIQEALEQVDAKYEQALNDIRQYFQFDPAIGMTIGRLGSPFLLRLTNEQMSFMDNQTVVAFINRQRLYITHAEILSSIKIGSHRVWKDANEDLTIFGWVGGGSS